MLGEIRALQTLAINHNDLNLVAESFSFQDLS
jgi:hypothetical protein